MLDQELRQGDLIFFVNTLDFIEHVAIYIKHKDGVPYIIHATTGDYNAVMLTRLKVPDEGCSYRVMRPLQDDVVRVAVAILLRWVEFQIPFSARERRDKLCNTLDNMGGFDRADAGQVQEPYGKASYFDHYAYYFQMANALPLMPVGADGRMVGLFCSEAIIAAFNVALIILHATMLESLEGCQWCLDPAMTLAVFVEQLSNPLPFDAQATLPAGMYEHCLRDVDHWASCGVLTMLPDEPIDLEKNKTIWREFKLALRVDAPEKVEMILRTPRHSPKLFALSPSSLEGEMRVRSRSSPVDFLDL